MVHVTMMLPYRLRALDEVARTINTHSSLHIIPGVSGYNQLVFAFISKCS